MLTHPTLTPYPSVDVAGLVDEEGRGGGGVLGLPTCLSVCLPVSVCVCLCIVLLVRVRGCVY